MEINVRTKGFSFYGAGAQGGPSERRTESPLNRGTVFRPADIIIFHEDGGLHETDSTGCNQWAFAVGDGRALYHSRGKVRSIDLATAYQLPNARLIRWKPVALGPYIVSYLVAHQNRPSHFLAGIRAMQNTNFEMFLRGELFPRSPIYESDEQYEQSWKSFISQLMPRDMIFTTQLDSLVSRFIAWATEGPFSHCALYLGNGEISEIVTSGNRIVDISVYKGRNYRVAAYRTFAPSPKKWKETVEECRAADGTPGYSYYGAISHGIRSFFRDHDNSFVPNSLIYQGSAGFIAQV
jgi:hypothetical protein